MTLRVSGPNTVSIDKQTLLPPKSVKQTNDFFKVYISNTKRNKRINTTGVCAGVLARSL